jgi:feruloyl esterase
MLTLRTQATTLSLALLVVMVASRQSQTLPRRASCESLTTLKLAHTTITSATVVDAGTAITNDVSAPRAFCRVAATLRPSPASEIKIELWLPSSEWNRKFLAVGNGAFNGTINYGALRTSLARGYATASTDTGHTGGGAQWALGHPEKVIDFGWRAVHEMTEVSKRIVAASYDAGLRLSYWNGCSAGGRQAMQAAQRFPDDFDGIIAGAPGLDWTGRATQAVRIAKHLETSEAARLLAPHRQLLHRAVVNACDVLDGVKDGLIESPERCTFDPASLRCGGPNGSECLTAEQVETAKMIYASPANPKSGRAITGLAYGSELGWTDLGWTASARATGLDQFRYIVFGDPAWTIQRFTFETDIVRAEDVDRGTINALDPNLRPFIASGGKLIQYHGWSDPQISPANSTQYYNRVIEALGGSAAIQSAYRLFMAPGMGHCSGGEGPNTFDMLGALEAWVEQGQAPDRITASHATNNTVDRTRPLCPYPQVAVYRGAGSTDDAANFACERQRVQ